VSIATLSPGTVTVFTAIAPLNPVVEEASENDPALSDRAAI